MLVSLWVVALAASRTSVLRLKLVETLSEKLDATVQLDAFRVDTFPRLRVSGDGLRIWLKGQAEPSPVVQVRHFEVAGGFIGLLHRQRHFQSVQLDGLRITIPPRSGRDKAAGNEAAQTMGGPVLIDYVEAHDAEVVLVPKTPGKEPRVFAIHHLGLDSVGFNRSMPFTATLTNPIPQGEIAVKGSFGPWMSRDPGLTPLVGRYEFSHADLNTIRGIGGMLSSTGDFAGQLATIDVRGTTHAPDFSVDTGARSVPLDTTFHAVVDGTDGDTYLKRVDAKFLGTSLTASGAVTGKPGIKGRFINLEVTMRQGRLEDVLRLAVNTPRPTMVGLVALQTTLFIPPGKTKVADRIQLDGRFALEKARFTDAVVQARIATLSSRSQGHKPDESFANVLSAMHGRFTVKNGVAAFRPVAFDVPGATVSLDGNYGLRTQTLAFDGTLRMDATISHAAGGIGGFFLKVADPLFKRDGAGAVVPIHVRGTRAEPKFGLDWKRVLTRK